MWLLFFCKIEYLIKLGVCIRYWCRFENKWIKIWIKEMKFVNLQFRINWTIIML